MCFSPQADLVGGAVIAAIGVDAVRHVPRRHGHLALAVLPLLLGAHQMIESIVWLSLQGHVPHGIGRVALWAYLLIALVVLPIFVPLAVVLSEPTRRQRWLMAPFVVIGTCVAGVLLAAMVRGSVSVQLRPYHLSYGIKLHDSLPVIVCYVVAVCGALLLSRNRHMVVFGIVNVVAIGVIAWLTIDGFASVWCAWAAITSGAIAAKMRLTHWNPAATYAVS
jgi:hypothetical protein